MILLTLHIRHCLVFISIADIQSQINYLIMKFFCALFGLRTTVRGMASKGLRAIAIKVQEKLKRATTLRIPMKPLLAIPRVVQRSF